jgi:hypothetical protein
MYLGYIFIDIITFYVSFSFCESVLGLCVVCTSYSVLMHRDMLCCGVHYLKFLISNEGTNFIYTTLLTYLTPWSIVLLEKVIVT